MFEGYGGPVQMKATDLSGIDPTLDACCQREIEGNRKQNALEATLKRHDRIALAERRRRNVIDSLSFGSGCRCCYDPNLDGGEYFALTELRNKLGEQNQEETDELNQHDDDKGRKLNASDSDNSDSDDEFDYLLDEDLPVHHEDSGYSELQSYEQQRLEEIQLMAMINESAVQHGFGVHHQFGPERVLHAAGLGMGGIRGNRAAAIPPAAVVHLYDPDSEYGASLDLCLEELGKTYKGTKFLFGTLKGTLVLNETLVKQEMPSLNIDECPPALLAVKDGVVKAICTNLKSLGDERLGKVEPRAVEHWLDNTGVLLRDIPLEYEDYCRIRPEEDALLENMMREKAKLEQMKEMIYTCGVPFCNKTFRHEHIGINNEVQSGRVLCKEIVTGEDDGVEK